MGEVRRFERLMEPGSIGSLRTKNRIIKTAAGTGYADKNGNATDRMADFYAGIAKGGAGRSSLRTARSSGRGVPTSSLRGFACTMRATSHSTPGSWPRSTVRLSSVRGVDACWPSLAMLPGLGPAATDHGFHRQRRGVCRPASEWVPGRIHRPGDSRCCGYVRAFR